MNRFNWGDGDIQIVEESPSSEEKALSWLDSSRGGAIVPPPQQGRGIKLNRSRIVGKKTLDPPKVKESYFVTCERDDEGHCLPSGQVGGREAEQQSDAPVAEEDRYSGRRVYEFDVDDLTFTEEEQIHTRKIERKYPNTKDMPPSVIKITSSGDKEIVDGHNRAVVAKKRGDKLPAVVIKEDEYDYLEEAGFDRMEIAHASLIAAGEDDAASSLAHALSLDVSKGYDAASILEDMREEQEDGSKLEGKGLLSYRTKDQGQPCQQGETAERSGCIPEVPKVKPSSREDSASSEQGEIAIEKIKDKVNELGSSTWDNLKQLGYKAEEVEHAAREWVEGKIKENVERLPEKYQKLVRGVWAFLRMGTKVAFATYTAGQKAAEAVAKERGLSPEQVERLKGILSTIDVASFKPISVGVGILAGPVAAGVGSFVPLGSLTYLAYSTAKDPLAVMRTAVNAVKGVIGKKEKGMDSNNILNEIQDWLGEGEEADWKNALLLAAIDETESLQEALQLAKGVSESGKVEEKSITDYEIKGEGQPCEQGETAARSGCIPEEEEAGKPVEKKPEVEPEESTKKPSFEKKKAKRGTMASAKRVGKGKEAQVILADGNPAPSHIKASMVPPDWTDVEVSLDPKADLLVTARDNKGRVKSVYSDKFHMRNAAVKFARVNEMIQKGEQIDKEIQAAREDDSTREMADCTWLMSIQATRPGSDSETGGKVKAYGATTLEGRHVKVTKKGVKLRFIGKEGVLHDHLIRDPDLAEMLRERAKKVGSKGRLFATNSAKVNDFISKLDGGHFSAKDFRTRRANLLASEEIRKNPKPPKDEKEYKKRIKAVAEKVSQVLGNRPQQALESYINPAVFSVWRIAE